MASIRRNTRSAADRAVPGTGDLADLMRALKELVGPYRPELHYMRGPGPKWRAKHEQVHEQAYDETVDDTAAPCRAGLRRLKVRAKN